jgi:hypothetical protein
MLLLLLLLSAAGVPRHGAVLLSRSHTAFLSQHELGP